MKTKEREKERKERTRKLIELGGLVAKSGLDSLESAALLGLLIEQKKRLDEAPNLVEKWSLSGSELFKK